MSNYSGKVNNTIIARVTDDFIVAKVEVEIYHNDGTLVEKGIASIEPNGLDWKFTAKVLNKNPTILSVKR